VLARGFPVPVNFLWKQSVPEGHIAFTSVNGTFCGATSPTGFQCDEYPYNASQEGGPFGEPSDPMRWSGFTLDLISEADNAADGSAFQSFKLDPECGLTTNTIPRTTIDNVPFWVAPMPTGSVSTHYCEDEE
jgi:hypothetical protein